MGKSTLEPPRWLMLITCYNSRVSNPSTSIPTSGVDGGLTPGFPAVGPTIHGAPPRLDSGMIFRSARSQRVPRPALGVNVGLSQGEVGHLQIILDIDQGGMPQALRWGVYHLVINHSFFLGGWSIFGTPSILKGVWYV